jgi:hypothetical protein
LSVEDHAFNKSIRETFAEATEISDQRAMEYGDTWALDRMRDGLLAETLQLPQPAHLRREFIRLVRCAVMIDIKRSRLIGPYKQDTFTDHLNYLAAYIQWRSEYQIAVLPFSDPIPTPSEGNAQHGIRAFFGDGRSSCPGCAVCNG